MLETIKKVLESSAGYASFSGLVGARRQRFVFINDFILKGLPSSKAIRILDIGCGTGEILGLLPEHHPYTGIDPNPSYVSHCQGLFKNRPNTQFFCGGVDDLESLPLETGATFDLVIMSGVLHHLDDAQVRTTFRYCQKVMSPSGRFLSLDGCFKPNQRPFVKWLLENDRGKFVRTREQYEALANEFFPKVQSTEWPNSLRIPSDHLVMEAHPYTKKTQKT